MKFGSTTHCHRTLGFTLPEMMIVVSLLLMVIAGVLTAHLFGLRMFQITKAKLGASDDARKSLSQIIEEVRAAKLVKVGSGNGSTFTEVSVNAGQQGSAIQIYPNADLVSYVRYYYDSNEQMLKRISSLSTNVTIMARAITNDMLFTSEDAYGNILTNNENNRVIGMTLKFYQIQFPITKIGPGNFYDFYQLRTKITRRTLE